MVPVPRAPSRCGHAALVGVTGSPAAQDRLDRMLRVTQRIRRISEGLIDFARVRRDAMEPVRYYEPVPRGLEIRIAEALQRFRSLKRG